MSRSNDEREEQQSFIFTDRFPIQFTAGFHRDLTKLGLTEREVQTMIDVFRANGLVGHPADPDEYLICCVISALSVGVYYAIARNLKGLHMIGVKRLVLETGSALNIRDAVDSDMVTQAKRVGISTRTENLKTMLRDHIQAQLIDKESA